MESVTVISEEVIKNLLNWTDTMTAVRAAMLSVTEKRAFQNPRSATVIPNTDNILFSMPGYLKDSDFGALACKLVACFPGNSQKGLPNIAAHITLFNENTGELEAILGGTEITSWRTAAASVVATQYIRGFDVKNDILAIVGAGEQGRIHAEAFQEVFKFNKVHIWNRNYEKAEKLCSYLNNKFGWKCLPFKILEECVNNADVIITATFSTSPLIKYEWLKKGVHINAVAAGGEKMELDEQTYKSSAVYVDHLAGIDHELQHITAKGVSFKGEIGSLIKGDLPPESPNNNTIFQSLGMAVEDCAVARMVYKKFMEQRA